MATSIRVISTSTVCAANHKEPNRRIDLTPWDLQLLLQDTIQKGLVFHKPKPDDPHRENLIHHLQTSLSRTLDFFLPLAGRLATVEHGDETTSFFIDCNNAGAEFVHAIADGVSVSDIIEQTYVPDHIVYSFFPLNGIRNYEGTSNPLLAVQFLVRNFPRFRFCLNLQFLNDGFFMILILPLAYLSSRRNSSTVSSLHRLFNKEFSILQQKVLQNSKRRPMPRLAPTKFHLFSTLISLLAICCS
ncbi:hypothetical protein LWI29_016195 [Acer saccharum]|uniref:Uncharacterized protein n=1 Tax=Acer saccharum TaxID=4024 RepID=A0AA39T370_ACESA|nr:hypothetical protein LWI29_016195 [Acer saccharum]